MTIEEIENLSPEQREQLYVKILRMKQRYVAVTSIALQLKVPIHFVKYVYAKTLQLYMKNPNEK